MPDEQKFYGLEGWDHLEEELDEAVDRAVEDACEVAGEGSDVIISRMSWPIRVLVYRHVELESPEEIGKTALDYLLTYLDENYGDWDGGETPATEAMKEAATALGKVVRDGYIPWECELTGEVIEVTEGRGPGDGFGRDLHGVRRGRPGSMRDPVGGMEPMGRLHRRCGHRCWRRGLGRFPGRRTLPQLPALVVA